MRWSIRQQVLVPIVAIQTLSIAAITIASMALAARRTERQIVERLSGVVDALGGSNFPLTDGILARMHSLSGARFVAYGPAGQPVAASDPGLAASPPALQAIPVRSQDRFDSLSDSPTPAVSGQNHFAALIGPRSSTSGTVLLVLYPELSWRDARWESAQVPLILGAGALALMAAATTWIAHRISGRIHRLEHQVARIAEGDFRELVLDPKPPRDEVNDLARSINRMCTQLRQMSQTIRQSERTHMLAQLAAGMAHQLRNALTGARLSIQLHLKRCEDARTDTSMTVALRRFADRHPSRDAAAEAAEIWDRVSLTLAIRRDPPGCRSSRTVPTTAWALAAGMARVAQAASSAVLPDDEAGRHGPVPELPACSSDFWPRSAV
ncbi:MAG: HAMP domain-containing protein [Isosphaeraceae bacterium]